MYLIVFMFVTAAIGSAAYLLLFMSHVPGAKEERFGKLEDLPSSLGEWVADESLASDGLQREQRHLWRESTGLGPGKLLLQERFREPETGEIVRVSPEKVIRRRRIRKS